MSGTGNQSADLKTGRRHSAGDEAIIGRAYALAQKLIADLIELGYTPQQAEEAVEAVESVTKPDDAQHIADSEIVTALGGMVKSVEVKGDEIHVGGYLVTFGSPDKTDLTGDYFTKDTDFGPFDKAIAFFDHGFDREIGRQPIGIGTLKKTDVGVWIDAILKSKNEYVRALGTIADQLGWSSGVAAHTVVRKSIRPGINEITQWFLGPDASLTPSPAEPRNKAMTLKSLLAKAATAAPDGASASADAGDKTEKPINQSSTKGATMSDEANPRDYAREFAELKTAMFDEIKKGNDAQAARYEQLAKDIEAKMNALPAAVSGKLASTEASVEVKRAEARAKIADYMKSNDTRQGFNFEVKAPLTSGTTATGGALVPVVQLPELVVPLNDESVLRRAGANVVGVSGTNSVRLPIMTNTTAAVLTGEGTAYNQQEPTFALQTYSPYKYTRISQATDENLADSGLDVFGQVLLPDATQAMAAAENAAFATGTGTSQPQGIVTGATTTTAAGASAIVFDDIINVFHALPYLHRGNGTWLMNDAVALAIRKLKDTTNQYLWQPGLQLGQPDLILGRPVVTLNTMSATISTGVRTIVFADLRYYRIIDFGGMEFKRLEERYAELGIVGFRWSRRFDGRVSLAAAVRALIQA